MRTERSSMFGRLFIVAEAGINHNGDLDTALRLVEGAADAGADAVKFQEFTLEELYAPASYERILKLKDPAWRDALHRLSFKPEWHERIWEKARRVGITCFSTPFHPDAVRGLDSFVPFYKVASGDITNIPLLESVAETGKGVFLSTGASTLHEIDAAVNLFNRASPPFICLMHCIMLYPPPDEILNLAFMDTLRSRYGLPVGFSDHTLDASAAILALGRGAVAVEKHFTLDRTKEGADHAHSLDPAGFRDFVTALRRSERMLGGADRVISEEESRERIFARRGLYAAVAIRRGEVLKESHLRCLRPVAGIGAERFHDVVGRRVRADIAAGAPLDPSMLEGDAPLRPHT
jgi:N,N'-diacetyllegionaminate synthase